MTQFWALPQEVTPSGPAMASRRSSLFSAPVGWLEQAHLADGGRADEVGVRVDLGADFQADAAGHAAGELIRLLPVGSAMRGPGPRS